VGSSADLIGTNAISVIVIILVAVIMGFRSSAGVLSWLVVVGVYASPNMDRGDRRTVREIGGRCGRLFLPTHLRSIYRFDGCPNRIDAVGCSRLCRKPTSDLTVKAIRALLSRQPVRYDI